LGGFLPFSAIYIELYYIFETFWGHHTYGLYGILFLVFLIVLVVTACIVVTLTYFQLSCEDHRWWWRSFISGGSTGFFVFAYCGYYFVFQSPMSGVLQAVKYASFSLVSCYFFFIMLGSVGFYSSLIFVRGIYGTLKID
jgi:transmembrane 9 superfamily member 3